jgi:hypothetical protein
MRCNSGFDPDTIVAAIAVVCVFIVFMILKSWAGDY